MVEGSSGGNPGLVESRGLGMGIGVERRIRQQRFVARPEAAAADFMRVSLARDPIRQMRYAAGMLRRRGAGESCHRQVEAAPEEMHRAAFALEAGAKFLQNAVGLQQRAPESVGVFGVVRAM